MIKCSRCNLLKDSSDFFKDKNRKRGYQYYCKVCQKILVKKWHSTKNGKFLHKANSIKFYNKNKKTIIKKTNIYNKNKDSGLLLKYLSIRNRCYYKSQSNYKYYGGRGIICEWNSYKDFKNDMYESYILHLEKHSHKNTTIDRIDSNKNYSKENCRWATWKEQASNRGTLLLSHKT